MSLASSQAMLERIFRKGSIPDRNKLNYVLSLLQSRPKLASHTFVYQDTKLYPLFILAVVEEATFDEIVRIYNLYPQAMSGLDKDGKVRRFLLDHLKANIHKQVEFDPDNLLKRNSASMHDDIVKRLEGEHRKKYFTQLFVPLFFYAKCPTLAAAPACKAGECFDPHRLLWLRERLSFHLILKEGTANTHAKKYIPSLASVLDDLIHDIVQTTPGVCDKNLFQMAFGACLSQRTKVLIAEHLPDKITTLHIDINRDRPLTVPDVQSLSQIVPQLTEFHCTCMDDEEDVDGFAQSTAFNYLMTLIGKTNHLTTLHLSLPSKILKQSPYACQALTQALVKAQGLDSLHLTRTSPALAALADAFEGMANDNNNNNNNNITIVRPLSLVDLKHCHFQNCEPQVLGRLITALTKTTQELRLQDEIESPYEMLWHRRGWSARLTLSNPNLVTLLNIVLQIPTHKRLHLVYSPKKRHAQAPPITDQVVELLRPSRELECLELPNICIQNDNALWAHVRDNRTLHTLKVMMKGANHRDAAKKQLLDLLKSRNTTLQHCEIIVGDPPVESRMSRFGLNPREEADYEAAHLHRMAHLDDLMDFDDRPLVHQQRGVEARRHQLLDQRMMEVAAARRREVDQRMMRMEARRHEIRPRPRMAMAMPMPMRLPADHGFDDEDDELGLLARLERLPRPRMALERGTQQRQQQPVDLTTSQTVAKHIEYYLRLNRCGRARVADINTWPHEFVHILQSVETRLIPPDDVIPLLYGLLHENPTLWTRLAVPECV